MTSPDPDRHPEQEQEDGPPKDEQKHYGEPQHETTDESEPNETMYGTPQHETGESLDDFELLMLERVFEPDDGTRREAKP
ncbi:hypothetical protein [Haladaptatus sp. NG-SE-30]